MTQADPLTRRPRTGALYRSLHPPEGVRYTVVTDRLAYPRPSAYYGLSPRNAALAAMRLIIESAIPMRMGKRSLVHSFFWDLRWFGGPWIHESDQSIGQFLTSYGGVRGLADRKVRAGFASYINSSRCRGAITWSEWARRGYIEDGVDASKVHVIPPPFEPLDGKKQQQKRKPHRGCNVLFVGRDYLRKGGAVALDAFEAAARGIQDARMIYVGKVDDATVRRRIASNHRVTYIDRASNDCLENEVWPSADVFLLPTRADAFAITVVEAMRRGIPVVASSLAPIREVVEDRTSGLLAAPNDTDAFASHLERLGAEADTRTRMGCEAKRRAEALFAPDAVNPALLNVYLEALAG